MTAPIPALRVTARDTVNAVLRAHPTLADVFNTFGVDACCGGERTLAEAAAEDGCDLAALVGALDAALVAEARS